MAVKLNYKELNQILEHFGFQRTVREGFIVFANTEKDALIVLPKGTDTTIVSPAHLLATKVTVIGKAAADASSFDDMVNTVTAKPRTRKVNKPTSVVKSP
jgi:hypothetical protein